MSEKLNICHVITRMIVGGAQENTLSTILDHVRRGHRVTLVTGHSPGREGELLARVHESGFELEIVPELVRELSPLTDWRAYCRLKRFFAGKKFDVVHTHTSKAGIIGRLAASAAGVPVVVHTVHGQAFHRAEKWWRNRLFIAAETWAARHSDRIFAVAQAMIDQCVEAGVAPRDRYRVVYSGMAIDRFLQAEPDPALRRQYGIPDGAKVIATLARLQPQKGYEFVMPAGIRVAEADPTVHFLLIGDGIWRERLQAEAAAAGLADRFHFAGLIAPDEVPRHLASVDMLWHLSLHEGLPRSAVQALGCGKPVIGFRLDGTPEVVIDDETGYCAAFGDVDEVVRRSCAVLNDPALAERLGAAGKILVSGRFREELMGEILEREYRELVDSARRRNGAA